MGQVEETMWADYEELLETLDHAAALVSRVGLLSERWQIETMRTRVEGIRDGLRIQIENYERRHD